MERERADEIVRNAIAEFRVPAASVAIVRDGALLYTGAHGAAQRENSTAATATTRYNVASVSKQFTSACILLLHADGKLSIDDSVARYFPELTRAADIPLWRLMSHTAGYPDYYPLGYADAEKLVDTTPDELIARYAGGPLQFEPGAQFSYTNTGYHILGRIIERVSGQSYAQFVHERIAQPLHMTQTHYDDPPQWNEGHAHGYTSFCMGPLRPALPERANWMYAAGALASTAADIARWNLALLEDRVLAGPLRERAMTSVRLNDGTEAGHGFGWFVTMRSGRRVVHHGGQQAGFTADNLLLPDARFGVCVLSNSDQWSPSLLTDRILRAEFPEIEPAPVTERADDPNVPFIRECVEALRAGAFERARITDEWAFHLTSQRLADGREGVRELGTLHDVTVFDSGERGGMHVARARLRFEHARANALLRRTLDDRIAEFNLWPAA